MKKYLLPLFLSFIGFRLLGQSSIILPNGNVIPSFTQANRPTTNRVVGQLIYQTDGVSGLYVWNGSAWTAVSSSTNGTVTNVTANSPIVVSNGSTTPSLSISQANATTDGFLSSTDWNTFNNKFTLPSLSNGSVLFSNGTSIAENNSSLKWDNAQRRFDISGLNNGSIGAGYSNWISASVGGSGGNRVVMGVQHGNATIGAHDQALSSWQKLVINPGGITAVGSLGGIDTRMVVANESGELSTQPLPTNAGTVTNVTGTAPISVNDGTTTPTISISQANGSTDGFLSSTDWNTFNNKQNALPNANGTTSGILTSTDWNTFNNKFSLPSLSNGSILFSNGTSIAENNSSLKWDNAQRRLDISGLNNGLVAAGFSNWISASVGGSGGNRVVMGVQNGNATIGAHNETLSGWEKLVINPGGVTAIGSLVGTNTRMVVANPNGELSTQTIPTNYGTVTNVTGISPILVSNTTTTPVIAISQANSSSNGFLSSADWNTFNNKQNALPNANGTTSGILTSTDWNTFNNKQNALPNASGTTSGILTNTDWTTFNNKFSLPSLTSGSILFSNGSTISQNNTSLFWDNNNQRLGIGLNSPSHTLDVNGTAKVNSLGSYVPSINTDASLDVGINGSAYNGTFGSNLNNVGTPIETFGSVGTSWAFDGIDNGTSYWVGPTDDVSYIGKDYLSSPKIIRRYRFRAYNTLGNSPQILYAEWTFEGSNDGSNWTVLHSVSEHQFIYHTTNLPLAYTPFYDLNNTNQYRYYRLNFTKFRKDVLSNGTPMKPSIFELEMYEENQSIVPQTGGLMVKKNGTVGIGLVPSGINRLEISGTAGLKVSSTNNGTGATDWIASNVGGTSGDRVVSGVLNGKAAIGGHNNSLNAWADLVINSGGGNVLIGGENLTPPNTNNTTTLGRPMVVNGSIRQGFYSVPVSIPANSVAYVTWTHNLGYGPIMMMSTDQNGGGSYMDYVVVTTFNNNANESVFVLRNLGGNNASGTLRWILVW